MTASRLPTPWVRGINSLTGLMLAIVAVLIPFVPLVSHQLDALALISLPLAVIAARMEKEARAQHG